MKTMQVKPIPVVMALSILSIMSNFISLALPTSLWAGDRPTQVSTPTQTAAQPTVSVTQVQKSASTQTQTATTFDTAVSASNTLGLESKSLSQATAQELFTSHLDEADDAGVFVNTWEYNTPNTTIRNAYGNQFAYVSNYAKEFTPRSSEPYKGILEALKAWTPNSIITENSANNPAWTDACRGEFGRVSSTAASLYSYLNQANAAGFKEATSDTDYSYIVIIQPTDLYNRLKAIEKQANEDFSYKARFNSGNESYLLKSRLIYEKRLYEEAFKIMREIWQGWARASQPPPPTPYISPNSMTD